MKKIRQLCLILCLVLILQGLCLSAFGAQADTDLSVQGGCNGMDAAVPLLGTAQQVENAEAVLLYELRTDTLMYAQNADAQLYPASLVKIMTALIAVEQGTMTDVVTVSEQVLSSIPAEATSVDLLPDEVLTLEELMYCMMVESANDAAAVIADHIAGSQNAFVAQMNSYAQQLGCTGTNFVNVTGLHHEQQVTTARDMARILSVAMKNELFCTLFSTTHYTVEATNKSEARNLSTGNHMMHMDIYEIYYDERVTGGRTGTTTTGDRCIATSAEKNGLQLICVMMGAKSKYTEDGYSVSRIGGFTETTAMLDLGFTGYKAAQLLYAGQALKQYTVVNGDADVVIGPQVSVSSVLPQDAAVADLDYRFSDLSGVLTAPVEKGQLISNVQIWSGNICVAQAELYAMNAVPLRQAQSGAEEEDDSSGGWPFALIVILVILLCLVAVLLGLRLVRKFHILSARNRSRKHRRNRRRSR